MDAARTSECSIATFSSHVCRESCEFGFTSLRRFSEDDALRIVCDAAIVVFVVCQFGHQGGNSDMDFKFIARALLGALVGVCTGILAIKGARIVQRNNALTYVAQNAPERHGERSSLLKCVEWALARIDGAPPVSLSSAESGPVMDEHAAERAAMRRYIAIGAAVARDANLLRAYFLDAIPRAERDRDEYEVRNTPQFVQMHRAHGRGE